MESVCGPLHLSQVTLETTIGNKNPALWKYVQPQGCVLEWIRNVVANRLAVDGATWAEVFKRFNSGTCVRSWPHSPYLGTTGVPGPSTQSLLLNAHWSTSSSFLVLYLGKLRLKKERIFFSPLPKASQV